MGTFNWWQDAWDMTSRLRKTVLESIAVSWSGLGEAWSFNPILCPSLPGPCHRLDHQEACKDEGHPNGLNWRVVCGQNNGQGDQRSSGQKWHSKPPGIQAKSEDQEAEDADTGMLLFGAPVRDTQSCIGAQRKKAKDPKRSTPAINITVCSNSPQITLGYFRMLCCPLGCV